MRRFEDYEAKLKAAKVVLDPQPRKDIILADAKQLAFAQGFELVEDQVLLDEVSGLVEWPVVLMGSFDPEFLSIPGEVIRATIRNNQKCFVVSDPTTGKLTNKFILTANIEASDGGKAIIAGNERVIRARLSRREVLLRDRSEDETGRPAAEIRADRIPRKARHAGRAHQANRAAGGRNRAAGRRRCRKDKARGAIWQGGFVDRSGRRVPRTARLDGKYYALAQGEDASVAAASEEHYKPQGPTDRVPTDPVSVAVALADKIDTLVGFWAIDEKPTGSKDPYALRRAALGVIRIVLERAIKFRRLRTSAKIGTSKIAYGKENLDVADKIPDDLDRCSLKIGSKFSCGIRRRVMI